MIPDKIFRRKMKQGIDWKLAKIHPSFEDRIKEVALERLKKGIDKKISKEQMSIRRYTKVMTRYEPLWDTLKKVPFKEEEQ